MAELSDRVFGRLTVIRRASRHRQWLCRCACGREHFALATNLVSGQVTSCGCIKREMLQRRNTTHGDSHTAEYNVWSGMKRRCYNARCRSFKNYGGRGITVCARWLDDFPAFLADMGRRPSPSHTIERKNNNGPYAPDNCVWIPAADQARNRRGLRLLQWRGETHSVSEWSRRLGFKGDYTIKGRLRIGWSIDRALSTPQYVQQGGDTHD